MPNPIFNGVLDAMFAPGAHIGVSQTDYSMTQEEWKSGLAWTVLGGSRTGSGVNLPSGLAKVSLWRADPANLHDVEIRCGGVITLAPGDYRTIMTDKNGRISSAALEGTGGATTAWQAITDPHTSAPGEHLDVDTTGGSFAIALPLNPPKYSEVYFRNSARSFAAHPVTIGRNGQTIMAVAEDMTVNTNAADFSLWFNGTTWQFPGANI